MSGLPRSSLRLVYVLDADAAADDDRVDAVVRGGVTALWLRMPDANGRCVYEAAARLAPRCRACRVVLLVGDRPDAALGAGAEGVQLGGRAAPVRAVRPWFPRAIGASCHSLDDVASAAAEGADHVVLSPVFGTPGKGDPIGVAAVAAAVACTTLPVVALGGITPENVAEVLRAGAAGVAAVRALRDAADPEGAARALSRR